MEYLIYHLFGSKTRASLLTQLIMNESKRFHILELSRILGIPHSMLIKEIANLETLGIVKTEKVGRTRLIGVNLSLPYLSALKEIIIKTSGLKDLIYTGLSKVKGIKYCLIFGSFANMEETAESDVDILVIGNVKTLELSRPLKKIEEKIGKEINYVVWDKTQFESRVASKNGFLMDITSKKVIMIVGNEDEFRRDAAKRTD
jgi:predicted nucleotidyltransferase